MAGEVSKYAMESAYKDVERDALARTTAQENPKAILLGGQPGSGKSALAAEAIRLARLLTELMPDEPGVVGLLAFLLLTESRRPARTDVDGLPVRLGDQDRDRWDRGMIDEGHRLVPR